MSFQWWSVIFRLPSASCCFILLFLTPPPLTIAEGRCVEFRVHTALLVSHLFVMEAPKVDV